MHKSGLNPAIYHGANSFAKEHYREKTHSGFGCTRAVCYDLRASDDGRWQSRVFGARVPRPAIGKLEVIRGILVEKER
jgi:hypothetical protein